MTYKYSELKKKEVINTITGKNLGKITDLVIGDCGKILKIIVPGKKNSLLFCEEIEISYSQISKIGDDIILVCPKSSKEPEEVKSFVEDE